MAIGSQRRTRLERVAALELPPGGWQRAWANLRRGDVLARIGLCLASAAAICAVISGWNPPFPYRTGQALSSDVAARVPFAAADRAATQTARDRARRQAPSIYILDPQPLDQLPAKVVAAIDEVMSAENYADVNLRVWGNFQPDEGGNVLSEEESLLRYQKLRVALGELWQPEVLRTSIEAALAPFRETGLLLHKPAVGSRVQIAVYPVGRPDAPREVKVAEVVIAPRSPLQESLRRELRDPDLADPVFEWIRHRLAVPPLVLTLDENATHKSLDAAAATIEEVVVNYSPGQTLAAAGQPLTAEQLRLLRLEHQAANARRTWRELAARAAAVTGLILALFALCAVYLFRRESQWVLELKRLAAMLALVVAAIGLATWTASNEWRAEIIPVLLFGQIVAIAYRQELALLLSAVVALILALAIGQGLPGFVLMIGATSTAVLQLGSIRSRSKLVYVGLSAGIAAILLTLGLAVTESQPMTWQLLQTAGCNGLWALAAGILMTGLLPFIEHGFGVLTDLSLLELADVSHPLLQELVRRAPSTYNHSITVGSIAEAAADAIGARGLLVRVGAYYHDIGKMLKPGYFIENQARDANCHESLNPAMSTLVIVAHIKDGADLARQHGLPQPIIDFIEQHHGTTLVEYFYSRATELRQSDPNGGEVDENLYRYPGPKPQTKEAGVLMLADAVESASRSLVDPAPSRIESLVREIAERKLDDGQFDESGLTLRELRTIENSMIKSLIAIYHGRVKYPEQRTA